MLFLSEFTDFCLFNQFKNLYNVLLFKFYTYGNLFYCKNSFPKYNRVCWHLVGQNLRKFLYLNYFNCIRFFTAVNFSLFQLKHGYTILLVFGFIRFKFIRPDKNWFISKITHLYAYTNMYKKFLHFYFSKIKRNRLNLDFI